MTFDIGLDVDGVLYRWGRAARKAMKSHFGLEVSEDDWFGVQHCTQEQWQWMWSDEGVREIYGEGEPFPGAVEFARKLYELGTVRIITAVPENAARWRQDWLLRYDIPFDELVIVPPTTDGISSTSKSNVTPHCRVYIDDSPNNCVDLATNTDALVILVDHSWNRGERWDALISQHGIVRAETWEDILRLVRDRMKEVGREETMTEQARITDEAARLVYGSRQDDYGHPRPNMRAVSGLIQAYLEARYGGQVVSDIELQAEDAAVMLLLLKIARFATGDVKRDTIIDMAGYAAVLARVLGLDE